MLNHRFVGLFAAFCLACLGGITTIIVQAQSDDNPPPDGATAVPDESSAIDWSQIELPVHEEPAVPAASVPAPEPANEVMPAPRADTASAPPPTTNPNTYVVQAGDTLFSIARRFSVSVADLTAVNHITNPSRIYAGQVLSLSAGNTAPPPVTADAPPVKTGGYTVQRGDTLSAIARKFGVDMIALAVANNIINPSLIRAGQNLTIPGATAAPPPANPAPAPVETPPGDGTVYVVQRGDTLHLIAQKFGVSIQALAAANQISNPSLIYPGQKLIITNQVNNTAPPPAESAPESIFIWPVASRRIVKWYAVGHRAIDIVVSEGTAVQAMAAGKIEYAGWNDNGYGNLVVIDHGNGWRTLYAHNSAFEVKTGDGVAQGDVIAQSGNTGHSSMPHVHLEMMLDFGAVNPCSYLPGGC